MTDLGTSLWLDQAVGHHVEGDLDKMDALALTAKIKGYVGVTWILLNEAHNRRADKALGYANWAEYVEAEFDMSRSYAYRLIAHAKAVYELAEAAGMTDVSPMGDIPERATRGMEIDVIAAEVERQASTLPADATDEDRAEVVKAAVAQQTTRTTTTETSTVTFDPETGEVLSPIGDTEIVEGAAVDEPAPSSALNEPGEAPEGPSQEDGDGQAPTRQASASVTSPGSPPSKPDLPEATPQESRRLALQGAMNAALRLTTQWTDHEQNLADWGESREIYLGELRSLARWIDEALAAGEARHLAAVK